MCSGQQPTWPCPWHGHHVTGILALTPCDFLLQCLAVMHLELQLDSFFLPYALCMLLPSNLPVAVSKLTSWWLHELQCPCSLVLLTLLLTAHRPPVPVECPDFVLLPVAGCLRVSWLHPGLLQEPWQLSSSLPLPAGLAPSCWAPRPGAHPVCYVMFSNCLFSATPSWLMAKLS